jgi:hypothetical protein
MQSHILFPLFFPVHNFDHAGHVTMSVSKLLARIVAPESVDPFEKGNKEHFESMRHDHTYGITSDPLTQFAVVLTALIHDAGKTMTVICLSISAGKCFNVFLHKIILGAQTLCLLTNKLTLLSSTAIGV